MLPSPRLSQSSSSGGSGSHGPWLLISAYSMKAAIALALLLPVDEVQRVLVRNGGPTEMWAGIAHVLCPPDLLEPPELALRPRSAEGRHDRQRPVAGAAEIAGQRLPSACQHQVVKPLVAEPGTAHEGPMGKPGLAAPDRRLHQAGAHAEPLFRQRRLKPDKGRFDDGTVLRDWSAPFRHRIRRT